MLVLKPALICWFSNCLIILIIVYSAPSESESDHSASPPPPPPVRKERDRDSLDQNNKYKSVHTDDIIKMT